MNFNEHVYGLVRRIPSGHVLTYGRVALAIGVPRGARAVGWALHVLAHGTDVPWHRVINAQGRISTTCNEHTAVLQQMLLEDEGVEFNSDGGIDLERYLWHPDSYELE